MTTPARTLVVWCPDWPVTAAGVEDHVAAAVVRANRVVACSAAARAEGVRRGLRRREAQGRCPQLEVLEHDPARDARAFEPVVILVESFTTGVEILRPGTCAFGTRGPARYFGGDHALAARVVERVGEATRCQAGVADGIFAAGLAARRGENGVVVPPGESPAFLAPFSVAVLDMPELADLLRRLGIDTLGKLAALPASDVLARFGPEGALAHRLASGLDARPLSGREQPPELIVTAEIDPPAERVDTASFAAKTMGDELHARMTELGLGCTRLRIEAETEHSESLVRVWRHDGPFTPVTIAERVRWQLDGWLSSDNASRPTAGISLLRLVPEEVGPDDGRQLGFWGSDAAANDRAARAIARVQGLRGHESVLTGVLAGGRSPAERIHLVPWGDPREAPRDPDPPWPGRVPPPAPATVHAAPLAAEVVDADGSAVVVTGRASVSAPPHRLSVGGNRWGTVSGWAGPWPVDERWWDPPAHRRRARFQIEVDGGSDGAQVHLLAVEGGRWSVEATYD